MVSLHQSRGTQVGLGPVIITFPNSARFVAEFYDAADDVITPGAATLAITYNFPSQTDTIAMSPAGRYFTAVWSSANAVPGLANWTVSTMGTVVQRGIIRVVDP